MQASISMSSVPTAHLPTWLSTAMRTACPVRVEFAQQHFVEVYPEQRRYVSDIPESGLPDLWNITPQRITPLQDATLSAREGHALGQLHWAVTLRSVRSQQRPRHFRFNVLHLVSWPPLADVPPDVCALLARRPTTASLVPLILDLPQDEVFALIEAVRLYGHLHLDGPGQDEQPEAVDTEPRVESLFEAPATAVAPDSLVRKIWQRLLGTRGA